MEVGILEKSRRLRIARISLDMLSPETYHSRPPGKTCLHPMDWLQVASTFWRWRAVLPSGFGSDCAVTGWKLPPSIAAESVREMSGRIQLSRHINLDVPM